MYINYSIENKLLRLSDLSDSVGHSVYSSYLEKFNVTIHCCLSLSRSLSIKQSAKKKKNRPLSNILLLLSRMCVWYDNLRTREVHRNAETVHLKHLMKNVQEKRTSWQYYNTIFYYHLIRIVLWQRYCYFLVVQHTI